ncbi:TPA: fimbria/pilus periplasmic chaperone [Citrobacter koseri]|nr:fimbria/pilus periplasmic chaperone [Citrobacter koseri]
MIMFLLVPNVFITAILLFAGMIMPALSYAGGIVLNQTRIIYPLNQKQSNITVRNTSELERYMIQSWVEDASGGKNRDFILTPPLFVSNPGDENALRLMFLGGTLPTDRESLYRLTVKAIPAVNKDEVKERNVLMLATAIRIKLFVRPDGLLPPVEKAPSELNFSRNGSEITVSNPTPYYITMVKITVNGKVVSKNVMVPPMGHETFPSPTHTSVLTYKVINDHGGMSNEFTGEIK